MAMAKGFGRFFPFFKAARAANTKEQGGTIFNYRKPKLRISLGIAVIMVGLAGGIYLSIRATQQDTSHLARIPRMITTPGGDTQRNSDQYQETVKLANQKNIASVEDTSESYILIPEVVTETIQVEEISVPLPWSTSDQEILSDQTQESEKELRRDALPQDKSPIANEKNTAEDLLAALNNSLQLDTPQIPNPLMENDSRQSQGEVTVLNNSTNFTSNPAQNDNSQKQSKYGLAVLNQMNAIANALVVQTPKAGFFTDPENQNGTSTDPSSILGNSSAYGTIDQNGGKDNEGSIKRISAGSIFYAEVIAEVTSDFPGPILVEITHGSYKGWRLVGQFNTSPGGQGVLVSFNKLVDLAGREFTASALAIDGIEGQSLIASKVEPRLLQRYGPVFATSFISGLAESLAQPRSTIGVIGNSQVLVAEPSTLEQAGYAGLKNSFSAISSDITNHIPRGPLITIQSGHPVGILFTGSTVNLN